MARTLTQGRGALGPGWRGGRSIQSRVARAFRVPATSCYYFARHRRGRAWWCVFPHPSGVNRWWNDPDNTRRAERYLRRLWEEAHQ